jgi:alkylation response protein AidB-like acyl-CoA dehydrogenase
MQLPEHQEILSKTSRSWLEENAALDALTERENHPNRHDDETWREMADLGWLGLCLPQELGGAEGGASDLEVLCEELGRVLLPPPFIAVTVAAVAAMEHDHSAYARKLLSEIAAGRRRPVLVVTDEAGRWQPGQGVELRGERITGKRSFVEGAALADLLLVPARDTDGTLRISAVDPGDPGVTITPLPSMAGAPWAAVAFHRARARCLEIRGAALEVALEVALDRAAVMHAAWCAGGARRLLEMTVDYVSQRRQFGVPLGSFQAVQHGLADCAIAAVECETMARRAARALQEGSPDAGRFSALAFVQGTTGFVKVARRCHQYWGGIGVSLEMHVHHFSRRAKCAEQAWGGVDFHLERIARELKSLPLVRDRYLVPKPEAPAPASYTPAPTLEEFREQVREFLEREIDLDAARQDLNPQRETPEKARFLERLGEIGWLGVAWPREFGGHGLVETYQVVLQDELEYAHMPTASIDIAMLGRTLMRHGSHALKKEFLPRIMKGQISLAIGYSEPEAGSDLANLSLRARRNGDEYVINGQKMWTSGAHYCDYIWLACRTDPVAPRHDGISLILIDNHLPGMLVQEIETMGDDRTNMVYFDDVRVPASRLVGEENRGWQYVLEALDFDRLQCQGVSYLLRDLDELIAWARSDPQRWSDPNLRRLVARHAVRVEGARSHFIDGMEVLARGDVPRMEGSMLKIVTTEERQNLADDVLDYLGPRGVLRDTPEAPIQGRFERNWRAEIKGTITTGTNEVQRNILAKRYLRLPTA